MRAAGRRDARDIRDAGHGRSPECMERNVRVTFCRHGSNYVDLTGPARIKWVFRANNLHALRPVVKLADGTLLVGNHGDVTPTGTNEFEPQMVESEFAIAAVRWYRLNAETIATTRAADNPDLSKVDEIGWADLMAGGGHGQAGWVNMGPFEVYGKPVKR